MGDSATFLASTSVLGTLFLINEYLLIIIITIQMENVNMEKVAEKKQKNTRTSQTDYSLHLQLHRGGGNTMPMQKIVFSQNTRDIKVLIK